jgi:hypothetical protein
MSPVRNRTVVLAAALFVIALAAPAHAAPLPRGDDFRYLPDNTDVFYVIRVDQLLASDGVKKLRKEIPRFDWFLDSESHFRKEYGLELSNVDRWVMGWHLKGFFPVTVLRLKKAVDVKTVLKAREEAAVAFDKPVKYKEEKLGAVTWYVSDREFLPEAFCFPDETTVVFGFADNLKTVLERKNEPVHSAALQAALKAADLRATITAAVDVQAVLEFTKALAQATRSTPDVDLDQFKEADGISLTINVGEDVAVRGLVVCKDAMTAEKVQKQLEAYLLAKVKEVPPGRFPKEVLDLPSRVKLSTRGSLVEASVSLSADFWIDSFKLRMAAIAPDRYVLDDSNVLAVIRVDQLRASKVFRKLRDANRLVGFMGESFGQTLGFGTDKIERVVFGVNTNRSGRLMSVFHLNSGIKAETILKEKARSSFSKPKLTEEKVGSFTLYAPAEGDGFCLVDDRTYLMSSVKELKEVLARTRPADLSAGLKEALKQADPGATLTVALDISALPADTPAPPGVNLKKVTDRTRAAVLTVKISGGDITLHAAAVCKDARGAEEVRKQAEAFRDFLGKQASPAVPKEIAAELLGKVKFVTRGNLVETTLTVKEDTAVTFIIALFPDAFQNLRPADDPRPPVRFEDRGPPPNPTKPPPEAPKPPVEKKP